jgi:cyclin H
VCAAYRIGFQSPSLRVSINSGTRTSTSQFSCTKSSQFCRMEFEKSSQAKSWIFSVNSLNDCKRRAISVDSELHNRTNKRNRITHRVRKFASGFNKRGETCTTTLQLPTLSLRHQEILIQFHAHQIQFLIGPNAVLCDLRTSERVLSTAIMFFRRFYMSNSVVEISPRKIAAACSFFAAKVEEEKVEVRTNNRSSQGVPPC